MDLCLPTMMPVRLLARAKKCELYFVTYLNAPVYHRVSKANTLQLIFSVNFCAGSVLPSLIINNMQSSLIQFLIDILPLQVCLRALCFVHCCSLSILMISSPTYAVISDWLLTTHKYLYCGRKYHTSAASIFNLDLDSIYNWSSSRLEQNHDLKKITNQIISSILQRIL